MDGLCTKAYNSVRSNCYSMYEEILITQLNDFIFCPASIYFHMLYGETDRMLYQSGSQIRGAAAHKAIDNNTYSTQKNILTAIDIYCEEYGLIGKIDMYDIEKGVLIERKRTVKRIYDGYVFQVYAQCIALREMGYEVNKIVIHSLTDNKNYNIPLPEADKCMMQKFCDTIAAMRKFSMENFRQTNPEKCINCIYEPACDRGLK